MAIPPMSRRELRIFLNLEEVLRFMVVGQTMTSLFYADRILVSKSVDPKARARSVERAFVELRDAASGFGQKLERRAERADWGTHWIWVVNDSGRLLAQINEKINLFLEDAPISPKVEQELERRARAFARNGETAEVRDQRVRTYYTSWKRRRNELRRNAGFCTECGTRPNEPELSMCRLCLDAHRQRQERRYREHKERGFCAYCTRPVDGKHLTCPEHTKVRRQIDHKYYEKHVEDRRRRAMAAKQKARENGLCLVCKKRPALLKPDGSRAEKCEECRDRQKRRRQEWIAQGLCPECRGKNPAMPGKQLCEGCSARFAGAKRAARSKQSEPKEEEAA